MSLADFGLYLIGLGSLLILAIVIAWPMESGAAVDDPNGQPGVDP